MFNMQFNMYWKYKEVECNVKMVEQAAPRRSLFLHRNFKEILGKQKLTESTLLELKNSQRFTETQHVDSRKSNLKRGRTF